MRPGTASRTALGTAMGRALESSRPEGDRLFADRLAVRFLPRVHRAILRLLQVPVLGKALLRMRERQLPGIMGNLLCRTRFLDDAFRAALEQGVEQAVILGAGLDSRAYRLPGAEEIRIFEVDHPDTQAWKRERVEHVLNGLPSHVTFVPIDFQQQTLKESMAATGFQSGGKTFVIWEGVTQYITAEAVEGTLEYISRSTAPGSRVAFTYIHHGLIDGTVSMQGARKLMAELERQGEPWCFGFDPPVLPEYLAERGLRLVEDVGAADYQTRYLGPIGRKMDVFEGERIAVAEVRGAEGTGAA